MQISQQQFETWHHQYQPRLLQTMMGILRNRDLAEEVTAAALATAFEKRGEFRGEASFGTWAEAIARNEARRTMSRNRTTSLESLGGWEPKESSSCDVVADATDGPDALAKLQRALRVIPAVYRRVLIDHFVRELPVKRIACRQRIPLGTVLSRISRAKRLLRAAWEV